MNNLRNRRWSSRSELQVQFGARFSHAADALQGPFVRVGRKRIAFGFERLEITKDFFVLLVGRIEHEIEIGTQPNFLSISN